MNKQKPNILTYIVICVLFLITISLFFNPVFEGKTLVQEDVIQAQAAQKEIMAYKALDGKAPLWTNSMFSGMPSFQIWTSYSSSIYTHLIWGIKKVLPAPLPTVLLYFLGMFVLLLTLKVRPVLAAAGGIAYAFFSYHFLILAAGHTSKALAISFFPFIIAGVVLTFRKKYLYGLTLGTLAWGLEIRANHLQMTYYLGLFFMILIVFQLIKVFRAEKNIKSISKTKMVLFGAMFLGILANLSMLWSTYNYTQASTRGKSILEEKHTTSGLDKDYAFQWSYGIGESLTFFIPNARGGASGEVYDTNSHSADAMRQNGIDHYTEYLKQMPSYWGEQMFVAGPVYFGIVLLFLFFALLRIAKFQYKQPLLIAIILTLLMAWGKNVSFFSNLLFDYLPFYNKFRAVSSILPVTCLGIVMFVFLGLNYILDNKELYPKFFKSVKITGIVFGVMLLLFALMPEIFFSFIKQGEWKSYEGLEWLLTALKQDRIAMFTSDAWRGFLFVAILFVLCYFLLKKQSLNIQNFSVALCVLILIDMWGVDARYINSDKYVEKSQINNVFQADQTRQLILNDKDPYFRVLDLTRGNPFSNAMPSAFFKSIGGYHAAKLRLYQDLIDVHFAYDLPQDILNMLNTKYVIQPDTTKQYASENILPNADACGNAWFVKNAEYVDATRDEINFLHSFAPKNEVVVIEKYRNSIEKNAWSFDPNSYIKLTSYHPDTLQYVYDSQTPSFAVFSDIYYKKGWNLYVDNKKMPYFRCDYLLRGAILPAGFHNAKFIFEPVSYYTGEKVSLAASIVTLLLLGWSGFNFYKKRKKK